MVSWMSAITAAAPQRNWKRNQMYASIPASEPMIAQNALRSSSEPIVGPT